MPFPDCVPELTDGVVGLRAHQPQDDPRIVEQSTDPDSMRWTTVPRPYGLADAASFRDLIEREWNTPGAQRHWVITDAQDPDGRYLGTIDLRAGKSGMAEVGFGLHPEGRGRGLMAAALRLVAAHFFNDLGGQRLYWWASRGNFASWRVAWACGFTFHATLPARLQPAQPAARPEDGWVASLGPHDDRTIPAAPWREAVEFGGRRHTAAAVARRGRLGHRTVVRRGPLHAARRGADSCRLRRVAASAPGTDVTRRIDALVHRRRRDRPRPR